MPLTLPRNFLRAPKFCNKSRKPQRALLPMLSNELPPANHGNGWNRLMSRQQMCRNLTAMETQLRTQCYLHPLASSLSRHCSGPTTVTQQITSHHTTSRCSFPFLPPNLPCPCYLAKQQTPTQETRQTTKPMSARTTPQQNSSHLLRPKTTTLMHFGLLHGPTEASNPHYSIHPQHATSIHRKEASMVLDASLSNFLTIKHQHNSNHPCTALPESTHAKSMVPIIPPIPNDCFLFCFFPLHLMFMIVPITARALQQPPCRMAAPELHSPCAAAPDLPPGRIRQQPGSNCRSKKHCQSPAERQLLTLTATIPHWYGLASPFSILDPKNNLPIKSSQNIKNRNHCNIADTVPTTDQNSTEELPRTSSRTSGTPPGDCTQHGRTLARIKQH